MLEHECGARVLEHECGARVLEHECGARVLEHECGARVLEHERWSTSVGARVLEHEYWSTSVGECIYIVVNVVGLVKILHRPMDLLCMSILIITCFSAMHIFSFLHVMPCPSITGSPRLKIVAALRPP